MYFDSHTHSSLSSKYQIVNIELGNPIPKNQYFSIGIHPWKTDAYSIESLDILSDILKTEKNCVAIGECGLDTFSKTQLEQQRFFFEAQLQLALTYKKPAIIHLVKAFDLGYQILKKHQNNTSIIIHGFNKNKQVLQQFYQLGCYFSFGEALISNTKTQETFIACPNDRILLETDNQNQYSIEAIYQQAAEIKKMDIKTLQQDIKNNFQKIFKTI